MALIWFRRRAAIASGAIRRKGLQVIVPDHRGRGLPVGTLRNIMLNAEIPGDEWTS